MSPIGQQATADETTVEPLLRPERLAALHARRCLNKQSEAAFDRLGTLAAEIVSAPVALVSLVDSDRQFFKCAIGLPEPWNEWRETPLSHSFCQHIVSSGKPLIIEDARTDERLASNLAIRDLNVIAYLGIPLVVHDPEPEVLGSFCVIDDSPRRWTDREVHHVETLARCVLAEIESRHLAEREKRLLREMDHRVRNNFSLITMLLQRYRAEDVSPEETIDALKVRVKGMVLVHDLISREKSAKIKLAALLRAVIPRRFANRVSINGPETVISAGEAPNLTIIMQELVTNAAKHGALQSVGGTVGISWSRLDTGDVEIVWNESGPPDVRPEGTAAKSTASGSGLQIIRDVIVEELGGDVGFDFDGDGLVATMSFGVGQP